MIAAVDRPDAPTAEPGVSPKRHGGGPKTAEGKERAKRNSLQHGLSAERLFPVDLAAAITARTAELLDQFRPQSPYEAWLVGEMGKASAKLDRCSELMILDLQRTIDRAVICWDDDRRAFVEDLGVRLPKDPARVAKALRGSKQGADWLLERWEGLSQVLQTNGAWDEPQRRLAFDLLGVPTELRHGSLEVPSPSDALALAALVAEEVGRLRQSRDTTLEALDEATRALVRVGMPMEEDAATRRLRRYEAAAKRAFLWAHGELLRVQSEAPQADESAARPPEVPPRPFASEAAMDYLAKRSRFVHLAAAKPTPVELATAPEMPPVPDPIASGVEAPVVAESPAVAETTGVDETPAIAEAPAFILLPPSRLATSRSASLTAAPRNRRARRAREKRVRLAARRDAR